jgi:hypothetical protein
MRTVGNEWLVPTDKDVSASPDGYVMLFAPFHEHGLSMPPHKFLQGMLHYYKVELQHLNPNGV